MLNTCEINDMRNTAVNAKPSNLSDCSAGWMQFNSNCFTGIPVTRPQV